MGTLNVKIDDALEEEFRSILGSMKGNRRGNLKRAVEEAIRMWIEKHKRGQGQDEHQSEEGGRKERKVKIVDSFLGLARETSLEVKGLKIRIGFGKILIPLEQMYEVYSSDEFNDLLNRYKLYKTINVIDDENFVVLIPKIFDEFTNTARKREMLKDWMAKNFKEFVKELVSLLERSSSQSQEAVE